MKHRSKWWLAAIMGGMLLCAPSAAVRPAAGAAPADGAGADKGVVAAKPKVAFFPLAGDADAALRERAWLSLRLKLERGEVYEVVDGPRMTDLVADLPEPVKFDTAEEKVRAAAKPLDADVIVWGDLVKEARGAKLRVRILDLRDKAPKARDVEKQINAPTDLRFASEQVLQALPGVKEFDHPNEAAVKDDALAAALWKKNPNLAPNGDFADSGAWQGMYQSEKYGVKTTSTPPVEDKVAILALVEGGKTNNVLAMNLSRTCAENNGLACISDAIRIKEKTRYRLSFRYLSAGPTLHVFVKGYTMEKNLKGEVVEREVYRRQVPPSGATNGKWVTVVDDLNPQHVAFPVHHLRIDLYAYLTPGRVMFDDVVLKDVGAMTDDGKDIAVKKPVTRPAGRDGK